MSYILLTTKPKKRLLSIHHPEWLYFLPTAFIPNPYFKVKLHFKDGTTSNHDLYQFPTTLRPSEVHYLDIGFSRFDYKSINPAKELLFVEAFILIQGDFTIESSIHLYPVDYNTDQTRAIYYHNSLGGLDSLICTGDQLVGGNFFSTVRERPFELGYDNKNLQQYFPTNQSMRRTVEVFTGYKPKLEIEALDDLFLLKRAYEYISINGQYPDLVPIEPELETVTYQGDKENLHALSFSYKHAFSDRSIDVK